MILKRLSLIILLSMGVCQHAGVGRDISSSPSGAATDGGELDKQLNILKTTLLEGKTEQIRIDAAAVMLFSDSAAARQIVLDALGQSENNAARVAVCRALSQTRAGQETLRKKEEFIDPLLAVLSGGDSLSARLAAEATLIFAYKQIQQPLEKIVTDDSLVAGARLNAIYALTLHPDIRAVIKLIELVDDEQRQVAEAAEKALDFMDVLPAGSDAEIRRQTTTRLLRQGQEAFLQRRILRQGAQMRKLEGELDLWRGRYLLALGKYCDAISEDAAKGTFLAGHLSGSEPIVKLWALEKVAQWRKGTANLRLSAELGQALVNLVSDGDRDVRLRTAKLLSMMGELDSAGQLLEQLKVERDDEVRLELFVALGTACYHASLPDSRSKISGEVRKQALKYASEYLSSQEAVKARYGADVMRKLLEQDGLTAAEVRTYLALLASRYEQQKNGDGSLRGGVLGAMAGLCAQRSVCRAEAAELYRPLFEKGLSDEADLVREAAVDGLLYINRAEALANLRGGFVNDRSITIRKKLIDAAGEVGGEEDLVWLVDKIGVNGEGEPAWQSILKILRRSGTGVLANWVARLESETLRDRLSGEQKLAFLEIAEQKAAGENNTVMLSSVSRALADIYKERGDFEAAARYLGMLNETGTAEVKKSVVPELLDVYLRWPKPELAAELVANCLLEGDIDPNSAIVRAIDAFLVEPPEGTDTNAVLQAMAGIEIRNPRTRPKWQVQLKRWIQRFGKSESSGKPESGW